MSDRKPIEQIIVAWKAEWGNQFPHGREDKLMQFDSFFATAKNEGYDSPEDFPKSVLQKVLYATVNENHKNKDGLKIWKQIHQELLDQAFVVFFNLVEVVPGQYRPKKNTISSGGTAYEPAEGIVERPALDIAKLGPSPEKATITLSEEDFLAELERGDDE